MKRIMTLLALGVVMLATFAASPASAAPRQADAYGGVCQIGLLPEGGKFIPGGNVNVTGEGFEPGETDIVLDGSTVLGVAHIGDDGTFSEDVTLPNDIAEGEHEIAVACSRNGELARGTFFIEGLIHVTEPAATTPLPRTGAAHADTEVVIGLAFLLVGFAFVAASRRRVRAH